MSDLDWQIKEFARLCVTDGIDPKAALEKTGAWTSVQLQTVKGLLKLKQQLEGTPQVADLIGRLNKEMRRLEKNE